MSTQFNRQSKNLLYMEMTIELLRNIMLFMNLWAFIPCIFSLVTVCTYSPSTVFSLQEEPVACIALCFFWLTE